MRLAAQMKLGYYPAHLEAIRALTKHLATSPEGPPTILDPCAGKGGAIGSIADDLGIADESVYAVELDEERAEACRVLLPRARVLGPASFMGSRITGESFSLAYVNPPFDDELGGGRREEHAFAQLATSKLVAGGVLALVMPITAISANYAFKEFLDTHYTDGSLYAFPAEYRHYREVVYFGRKRAKSVPSSALYKADPETLLVRMRFGPGNDPGVFPVLGSAGRLYALPPGRKPSRFEKIELTEKEMLDAVNSSRLLSIFDPPPELEIARPPLPPYTGHVAQLLAAGMLNGVVQVPNEPPHVVRGTAEKEDVRDSIEPILNADGDKVGEREIWIQIIKLTVRVIGLDGLIKTFASSARAR